MQKYEGLRLPAALGLGAGCFLLLALVLSWNFFLSAALGVGVYLGLWLLLAPKSAPTANPYADLADGEELAALMAEARRDLDEIHAQATQIAEKATRISALDLAITGENIYRTLQQHPEKIPEARRFLTYYLDTVGKILRQYTKEQQADLHTGDSARFAAEIKALLPKLNTAFEQQLSNLLAAERFDAQADMTVLENMLKMEGLTDTEELHLP